MRKLNFLFVISYFCCSFSVTAGIDIHFSKVQLYLNDQIRTDSFLIDNQGADAANCSITLTHYQVSENGKMERVKEGLLGVHNPANKLVRYSPRTVKIPPYTPQTVRVSFRRIPKLADGEYVSFLRAECRDELKVMLGAKIAYNLPVIVRHGKVNSDNEITSTKLVKKNGKNKVEVVHERLLNSTSSIIGNYELIGKESGKVYSLLRNSKLYAPGKSKVITLKLIEDVTEPLQVKFTMEPKLGEEIIVKDVTD